MKKLLSILTLGMFCFLLWNCSDDDINMKDVPSQVIKSFESKYPGIDARWEKEQNLYKADFRLNGKDADAWFSSDGQWQRTEVDILKSELPQIVSDAIKAAYSDYVIDDANWIETPAQNYYDVEIEKGGTKDLHICVTVDGKIL